MSRAIVTSWGSAAGLTGVTVPLFGILLSHDIPCEHSRRRSGGQRGGPRSGGPRHCGEPVGNAPRAPDPRAPYGRAGRARLLELPQEHQARQRGGTAEGGACGPRLAAHGGGPGHGCGGRRCPGCGSDAVQPGGDRARGGPSPHRGGASGGDGYRRARPRGRRGRPGERPAHLRRALLGSHGPDRPRRPGLLRRRGPGGDGGLHRSGARVPPEPLRGCQRRRRLPERSVLPGGVRALRRRAALRRAGHRQGLRESGAVPGLPAH